MNQMWGKMPGWAQFLAIFLSAVMLTLGVSNREGILSTVTGTSKETIETVNSNTVEVKFLIYSESANDPVERAEVQFIFDGAPAPRFTDSDGYVRVEIPERDDIDVVIKAEGFKDINRTINLLADPNRTIRYLLETDESLSSYRLGGKKISEGTNVKRVHSSTFTFKTSKGNLYESTLDSPVVALEFKEERNKEVDYKFVEVADGIPVQIVERIGKDKISSTGDFEFISAEDNKTYDYTDSLSERGILENSSILNERRNEQWYSTLSDQRPSNEQKKQLEGVWAYRSIFYEYPKQPLKVGQSWDFSNLILTPEMNVTESNVVATLTEITDYNGYPAALISVDGSMRVVDSGSSQYSLRDRSPFNEDSDLTNRLAKSFREPLAEDLVEDYFLPSLLQQVSEDLYFQEFTLKEVMKQNSPELYYKLIDIYNEVSTEENFDDYSLQTIEAAVSEKSNEKSIGQLLTEEIVSILEEEEDSDSDDEENNVFNLSLKGKIYRSLEQPFDLFVQLDIIGTTEDNEFENDMDVSITERMSIT